jgi:hypothetical protein
MMAHLSDIDLALSPSDSSLGKPEIDPNLHQQ